MSTDIPDTSEGSAGYHGIHQTTDYMSVALVARIFRDGDMEYIHNPYTGKRINLSPVGSEERAELASRPLLRCGCNPPKSD